MIHIACNIDDNYVMQCCTMLVSVMHNNQNEDICFHVISHALSKTAQQQICKHVASYGQQVVFYDINDTLMKGMSVDSSSHISIATYYRLFIAKVLPTSIHKLLYLDCDLVVDGNISTLWDIDITQYAVAAVEDMWSGKAENYERLNYSPQHTYFNAGVLVINLDKWREMDFAEKSIGYVASNQEKLVFYDQDVLNALLHDQKKLLPFRWNVQDGLLRRHRRIRPEMIAQVKEEIKHPVIIHYTGHRKPWMHICLNPFRDLFFKYVDMTDWKGFRPQIPFSWKCKTAVDKLLYTLYLKPKKYDTV